MVYAVIGGMAFQNAARRNNAHNFVVTRLSAENMWEPPFVQDTVGLGIGTAPDPALYVRLRFVSEAARDTFYTDTLAQLQGVNGPVTGSWIAKHTCDHDQDPPTSPCVVTDRHAF